MTGDLERLRRLIPYLRSDATTYGLALACAPLSAALTIAQPYLMKVAIDQHIVPMRAEGLALAALAYLGAVLAAFVLESLYNVALSYAATRTITRLRRHVYVHTLGFAQSFWDREPTGKILTRTTSDIEALGETLSAGAVTIVLDVMLVLGIVAAMFALDPWLTLSLLMVSPILAVTLELIRRVMRRLFLEVRTAVAALNAFMTERLEGLEVVQLYSDEARAMTAFRVHNQRYTDASVRTNLWDALLYAIVDGLSSITMAMMLWYGASDAFGEPVTAGLLAAFIDYIAKLFAPIREFSAKLAVIQRASSALEKVLSVLDHDERVPSGSLPLDHPRGEVVFRDVCFAYPGGADVLRGVDLTLRPGEVVAVVGRTGSGKTTLGKLLLRSYHGYRGDITVDGVPLDQLRTDDVRRAIGVVHQDVHLFPGTVRDNLALGRTEGPRALTDERLLEAIRLARADDVVAQLGGLDGIIRHGAKNVSVGEAQLLSFARTLAHDNPIVILDEATASVDTLTEQKIQAATEVLLQRKTVLVVAHRLSTIVNADQIVVLDAGLVVERGTHRELLDADGVYAKLFRAQFAAHHADQPNA
jgi:ATP-binding cassette subfamily B multidrug efflux pump